MDFSLLEDFLAVLNEGGFSRAAERRAVTQPAFSRRIRTLENWIGTSLFDRSTHAIRLTPSGEIFRPAAEELLRQITVARQDAQTAAQSKVETLRLSATHSLSLTFFPIWLRALEARNPTTVTVQLTSDTMAGCEKMMVEGRAQFLFCHTHPATTTRLANTMFKSLELGQDSLIPVAAPDLSASIKRLRPYLAYTSESGKGRILAAAWAAAGKEPPGEPVFSSPLASVLVAMAREGRGVAWVPSQLVADDVAAGRLAKVGAEEDAVAVSIRLYRPKARQTAAAEAFWERAMALQH